MNDSEKAPLIPEEGEVGFDDVGDPLHVVAVGVEDEVPDIELEPVESLEFQAGDLPSLNFPPGSPIGARPVGAGQEQFLLVGGGHGCVNEFTCKVK